jgi:chromosome partitioning protein
MANESNMTSERNSAVPKIAYLNTKGGTGKTTSTVMTAAAGAYDGQPVTVADLDQQGSASEWLSLVKQEFEDRGETSPVDLMTPNLATLGSLPADRFVLIDTPPGNPGLLDRVVAVSDLVIIPTTPSVTDIDRVWQTLRFIPAGTPVAVLLTQVNAQAVLVKQTRQVLEDEDVLVFPTQIPRRESFRKMFGTWPANDARELLGYEDVFAQIKEILA